MTFWDTIILSIPIVLIILTIFYYGLSESFTTYGSPFQSNSKNSIEIRMANQKRNRPKNIQINYKLIFAILLSFILVIILPLNLYPGTYYVKEVSTNILNVLRTILSIEGSLLGLLFALTVLTYNSSKDNIGNSALTRFFASNRILFDYFTVLTITILVTFLSFVLINSNKASYRDINAFVACALLFLLIVSGLVFLIKETMSNGRSLSFIEELINEITIESVNEIDEKNRSIPDDQFINIILSNPIYLLSTVLKNSIDREDYITSQVIFRKSVEKSIELIGDSPNKPQCDKIITSFNIIWDTILTKCFNKDNPTLLTVYLVLFNKYHEHWLKHKLGLQLLDAHFEIMNDLNRFLIKNGNDNLMNHFSWSYEKFFIQTLKNNTPPENQIWEIYYILGEDYSIVKNPIQDHSNQWAKLSDDFLDLFTDQFSYAIEFRRPKIFENTIRIINTLISSIDDTDVEESKKHILIITILNDALYQYKNALDTGVFKTTDDCSFIEAQKIYELIGKDRKYYALAINSYFETILQITIDKQLGKHSEYNVNLGAIGRYISSKYNEDVRYSNTFDLLLLLIDKLRVIIEPNHLEFYDQYLSLIKVLESCKRTYLEKNGSDSNSENFCLTIDEALLKFEKKDDAKRKLNSSNLHDD